MIHEYALEPELVATWTDRSTCRYFKENFGLGQGRLVSRYPKRWNRLVRDAFRGNNDLAQKRLEVLLVHLSERMVRRSNIRWDADSTSWLENAEREHERRPFHAILARNNPENHAHVLTESEIEDESALWKVGHGRPVKRNAVEMAEVVAPLLRCSLEVIFVDPHFGPDQRYRRPFEAFLERMVRDRPGGTPKRIEVHTIAAKEMETEKFLRGEFGRRRLHRCVPQGLRVLVRRLRQQEPGGEKLHNRYILTDLGGITFGTGLDTGNEGETDDITLMDRSQYELRWSQYGGDPPAEFEQEGDPIEVVGTRTLPTSS